MAITGSGTEQDPFIVHSYDELRELKTCRNGSNLLYAKLANDINCNDYDVDFEWETVEIGDSNSGGMAMELDLDGHTVKNIKVKAGSKLFDLKRFSQSYSAMKNGKILNAFLNNAHSGIVGASSYNLLQNLSISINATGITDRVFNSVGIDSCAIYIESFGFSSQPFYNCTLVNSDLKFIVEDLNTRALFSGGSLSDCRMTGKCKGRVASPVTGVTSNNCVFSVDLTEANRGSYAGTINAFSSGSGICNISLPPPDVALSGGGNVINVTSEEIVNGDALRAKGFLVVNVVGD